MTSPITCLLLGSHMAFGHMVVTPPHNEQYQFESCKACEPVREKVQKHSAWNWQCTPKNKKKFVETKDAVGV